jgi:hypothetical protein
MAPDAEQLRSESFVMDVLSFAALDEEYANETLPNAGVDAIRSTVDTCTGDGFRTAVDLYKTVHRQIEAWPNVH